ncbi:MAG: flagellar hook basal-body protein [Lentisphaeria bacterium]|jgi:flagellar basal body rod protein FlgG|nr:flagellar hook basal-body protein [Lentisphaeria bacterium]
MLAGLYNIGSRLMMEGQRQELIAQNLAGAGLCGFKGRHLGNASFQQQLADRAEGKYGQPLLDFSQGSLAHTGRSLDLALEGPGFFQVQTADGGELLTRNGNFNLSPTGFLVTQEGHMVLGQDGPIRFAESDDATRLEVTETGELHVPDTVAGGMRRVGVLRLGMVADPTKLERLTANYFRAGEDVDVQAAAETRVCNGYQEQANVSPVREMAAMIQSLREFESGHKMIQTLNELTREENQKLV